ncbi:MAG: HAD family hydrolase [Candidatus Omnitrophica bacterium]|nr:HAD family hydrolase [Candidatus Omnitrophota bacterium]
MNTLNYNSSNSVQRSWVFMDAGDTFIYGYPTFYQALRDCCRKEHHEIDLMQAEQIIKATLRSTPPVNLTSQEKFTQFFQSLYTQALEKLHYPNNVSQGVQWLWEEWLKGERLRLFDDSLSALHRLRKAGFKLSVISNWDETFDGMLERLGVSNLFEFTLTSIQTGFSKPDKRLFQLALHQAGVSPDQAWYLGDQIDADIRPAREMGFKTIYVDYYNKGGSDGAADHIAPSMSVAAEIICEIETRGTSFP